MLIKSIIYNLAQGILIISLIGAGSFVWMEETSEKTEKTEKSEEALHSTHCVSGFKRSIARSQRGFRKVKFGVHGELRTYAIKSPLIHPYNIDYIYTTSYLDRKD